MTGRGSWWRTGTTSWWGRRGRWGWSRAHCTVLYCTVQVGVVQGAVRISLQYFPLGLQEADSSRTIATYFPPREEGNRVTLYQCADTPQLPVFQVMKERLFPIPAQEVPLLTSYNHSGPHQS